MKTATEVTVQDAGDCLNMYAKIYYSRIATEAIDSAVEQEIRIEAVRLMTETPEFKEAVTRLATKKLLELLP